MSHHRSSSSHTQGKHRQAKSTVTGSAQPPDSKAASRSSSQAQQEREREAALQRWLAFDVPAHERQCDEYVATLASWESTSSRITSSVGALQQQSGESVEVARELRGLMAGLRADCVSSGHDETEIGAQLVAIGPTRVAQKERMRAALSRLEQTNTAQQQMQSDVVQADAGLQAVKKECQELSKQQQQLEAKSKEQGLQAAADAALTSKLRDAEVKYASVSDELEQTEGRNDIARRCLLQHPNAERTCANSKCKRKIVLDVDVEVDAVGQGTAAATEAAAAAAGGGGADELEEKKSAGSGAAITKPATK